MIIENTDKIIYTNNICLTFFYLDKSKNLKYIYHY